MATSFPCKFKGKSCSFCPDYSECQKAQGLPYRKWAKANTVINTFPDGSIEFIRYKKGFDYLYEAGNLPSADRVRKMIKEGSYWIPVDGYDIASLQESIKNSNKRSLDTMYGYVLSNDWEYFVTLTFSPDKVNRFDDNAVKELWSKFQRACKRSNPNCKILAIPERHPTSGALHFHALMSDIDLKLTPAINKEGKPVYSAFGDIVFNVNAWDFGFSTATVLPKDSNRKRVANYLVKYITKDGNIGYNAKRYYHTRNLDFKNKVISVMTDEDISLLDFELGMEKKKDNEKMSVYYYSPKKHL